MTWRGDLMQGPRGLHKLRFGFTNSSWIGIKLLKDAELNESATLVGVSESIHIYDDCKSLPCLDRRANRMASLYVHHDHSIVCTGLT